MFRGISCVPVTSVLADPAMKDVVVIRLVDMYPGLVLKE